MSRSTQVAEARALRIGSCRNKPLSQLQWLWLERPKGVLEEVRATCLWQHGSTLDILDIDQTWPLSQLQPLMYLAVNIVLKGGWAEFRQGEGKLADSMWKLKWETLGSVIETDGKREQVFEGQAVFMMLKTVSMTLLLLSEEIWEKTGYTEPHFLHWPETNKLK